MKIEQYICDQCGARKGESNHWWVVMKSGDTLQIIGLEPTRKYNADLIRQFCSAECTIKTVSQFLGGEL